MQKSFTSGILIGVTITLLSISSLAYAANGGLFGDILNKILASGNWESPGDGTVKNAQKLGGIDASGYQKVNPSQSCGVNNGVQECIVGFDTSGNVDCK